MARHVDDRNFTNGFCDYFRDDIRYIVDKLNQRINDLAGDVGGQFDEIDRNFNRYRRTVTDLVEKITSSLVRDSGVRLDDCINDVVMAALVIAAVDIDPNRYGSADADDLIEDEFNRNDILRQIDKKSNRRDDYRRDDRRDSGRRDSYRRDDRRRNDRREAGKVRSVVSASTRADTGPDVSNSNPLRRGGQNEPSANRYNEEKPVKRSLNDGTIITSENFDQLPELMISPLYVIGAEQIVFRDGNLVIEKFEGTNEVDYTKHSIDRFYPDLLGKELSAAGIAEAALNEINKVRDFHIDGFVKGADGEEPKTDEKMFAYLKSATYNRVITQESTTFDPIETRNYLLETHKGDVSWFSKYCLKTTIEQLTPIMNCGNDGKEAITAILESKRAFDVVKRLIEIYGLIDIVAWKRLHDLITARFNTHLVRNNVLSTVDTITGDWPELTDVIAKDYPYMVTAIDLITEMLKDVELMVREEGGNKLYYIKEKLEVIFMPLSGSDLDVGTATPDYDFCEIVPDTIIYNAVKDQVMECGTVILVTSDNQKLELISAETILKPGLILGRRIK